MNIFKAELEHSSVHFFTADTVTEEDAKSRIIGCSDLKTVLNRWDESKVVVSSSFVVNAFQSNE